MCLYELVGGFRGRGDLTPASIRQLSVNSWARGGVILIFNFATPTRFSRGSVCILFLILTGWLKCIFSGWTTKGQRRKRKRKPHHVLRFVRPMFAAFFFLLAGVSLHPIPHLCCLADIQTQRLSHEGPLTTSNPSAFLQEFSWRNVPELLVTKHHECAPNDVAVKK